MQGSANDLLALDHSGLCSVEEIAGGIWPTIANIRSIHAGMWTAGRSYSRSFRFFRYIALFEFADVHCCHLVDNRSTHTIYASQEKIIAVCQDLDRVHNNLKKQKNSNIVDYSSWFVY